MKKIFYLEKVEELRTVVRCIYLHETSVLLRLRLKL